MNVVDNTVRIVVCFTVKAFLAQAKEEFTKKWDEPPQVCRLVSILVTNCEFVMLASHGKKKKMLHKSRFTAWELIAFATL